MNLSHLGWITLAVIWVVTLVNGWAADDLDHAALNLVIFTAIILGIRWAWRRRKQ